MRATGREAADRLEASLIAGRQADADTALALHDMVVGYDIEIDDDLIEELLVTSVRGGGEGTPRVHEFVHLELCGLLGVSARHARSRIFEVLNLKYRHPTLWAAVQGLGLEMYRAGMAAMKCSQLSLVDADLVGRQWFHQQEGLSFKAALDLLDRLIIEADPALAKKRQDQAAACREVVLRGHNDGVIDVSARMDALDALYLDATVDQLADILRTDEADAAHTKQVLRAKALGILATPALALGLQQQALNPDRASNPAGSKQAAQDGLLADPGQAPEPEDTYSAGSGPERRPLLDPETGRVNRDPHHCIGHVCGRITVPPAKLQPKSPHTASRENGGGLACPATCRGGDLVEQPAGVPVHRHPRPHLHPVLTALSRPDCTDCTESTGSTELQDLPMRRRVAVSRRTPSGSHLSPSGDNAARWG